MALRSKQEATIAKKTAKLASKTVASAAKKAAPAVKPPARAPRKKGAPTEKTLSRDRIVAVALEQIDSEGLHAFSLREVARQLDVYPTAVYWHVPNRDALLAAVVEYTMAGVAPEYCDQSWQDWLRELFRRYRKAVQKHPNVAQLVGAQLVSNASLSPLLIDRILSVLLKAGCDESRLLEMYNVVIATMVGFATLEFAPLPTDDLSTWADQLQQKVHEIRALEYPTLARHLPALANRAFIVRWQSGRDVPLDSSFETFVDVSISGIERCLAKRVPVGLSD